MATVESDWAAIVAWLQRHRPQPRGVTVYTGTSAEHYATAHRWVRDDKGTLDVLSRGGHLLATFIEKTWFRVEAGSPPAYTPPSPRNETA